MPNPTILPDPDQLHLLSQYADADGIVLTACTSAAQARCPVCDRPSGRVYS